MTAIENKCIDAIVKHRCGLLVALAVVAGLAIRWAGRNFVSEDMVYCLRPWFEQIKQEGGMAALSHQVGNYGLLYQTLIAMMTYIDLPAVLQYKLLSGLFDAALAVLAALMYRDARVNGGAPRQTVVWQSCLVGSAVWLLPTVMLNSWYWAQCDAIYTFFGLSSLYLLKRGRPAWAFVMLGVAFGCKLQAVFFLPLIGAYYLSSKRFSIGHAGLTVVVAWLTGIVAFLYGRSLMDPVLIYMDQSSHYREMFVSFPSAWMIVGNDYWALRWFAILFTVCALAAGLTVCLGHRRLLDSDVNYYAVGAWFVWTMLLFLPGMHDRYAYPLDLLLLLTGLLDRRFLKHAVVAVMVSLFFYGCYLVEDRPEWFTVIAVAYLATYLHFTRALLRRSLSL